MCCDVQDLEKKTRVTFVAVTANSQPTSYMVNKYGSSGPHSSHIYYRRKAQAEFVALLREVWPQATNRRYTDAHRALFRCVGFIHGLQSANAWHRTLR